MFGITHNLLVFLIDFYEYWVDVDKNQEFDKCISVDKNKFEYDKSYEKLIKS